MNNAVATNEPKPFTEITMADYDLAHDTGPRATFFLMQAAYPALRAAGGGSIVNLGSGTGTEGKPFFGAYASAKEAIRGMSKVAALEWGRDNIRVNVVCPFANPRECRAGVRPSGRLREITQTRSIATGGRHPHRHRRHGRVPDRTRCELSDRTDDPPRRRHRDVPVTRAPREPAPSLRDRQRDAVRADIHAAAYRLFAAQGFTNVTTDDIAAEAAISPRTFFRHVATKEELLLAAVQRGGAAIASLLERRPRTEPPDAALAAAIVSRVESFDDADLESWRARDPDRAAPAGSGFAS